MNFNEAFKKMKEGYKIKRPDWVGYWCVEDDTIQMYCKDGKILDLFTENEDKMFTAENLASDDFVIATKDNCLLLQDNLDDLEKFRLNKAQLRACRLMKDIENACIKNQLNITIKNGKIGFVDQELNKIVVLWTPEYNQILYKK